MLEALCCGSKGRQTDDRRRCAPAHSRTGTHVERSRYERKLQQMGVPSEAEAAEWRRTSI